MVEEKLLMSRKCSSAPTSQVEEKLLKQKMKNQVQVYSLAPTKKLVEEKLLTLSL